MTKLPGRQNVRISADGSHVKVVWFDDGANAVVSIIRKKRGVSFSMSRTEAEVLRALLPAGLPDDLRIKNGKE